MSDTGSIRLSTSMYLLALLTIGAALYLGYQMGVNGDPAEALRTDLAACLARQVAEPGSEVVVDAPTQPEALPAAEEAIPMSSASPTVPSKSSVPVPAPSEN